MTGSLAPTELGRLADDLTNVVESVEIPILILDSELRLRRFTPGANTIVSIVADVAQPITDLSLKVDVPDFRDIVCEVMAEGTTSETEVRGIDGRWYSMRVRPYRTSEGRIDGAVIAFIDISELKSSLVAAHAATRHAEAVVETVRAPLLTLGPDLSVREANHAFYETFAVSDEETIGKRVFDLGDGQWDFPELRSLLERVLPGDQGFADLEVEREFARIGHRVMVLYARRVREEEGQPSILLAIDDVTEQRRQERLSAALNHVSVTIGATPEFDQILERVLKDSTEALGADSAAVLLRQDGAWVLKDAHGMPRKLVGQLIRDQEVVSGRAASETGDPEVLTRDEAARFASALGMQLDGGSVLVVPLLLRHEEIGSVSFHYRLPSALLGEAEISFARRMGTLLSLAIENAKLYAEQRNIADTLQTALLTVPRRIPGIDYGYLYRSATAAAAVGGDFYDFFALDGNRAGVLLGDVSGKGVQAATLTALVKNTIRALAYENDSPAAVVSKTSAAILKATTGSVFVTLLYGVLDVGTGGLTYCSAGHTRGIVKKSDGSVTLLDVGSTIAGAFEQAEFVDGEAVIARGDVLVLYTDGVTEARRDGSLFGEERLVEFIQHMDPTPSKQVPEAIFEEVMQFTGGSLSDDVAIVSVARGRQA
ncbi:MAG TPA: SpoIIE family protein phosphatase [Coriobacteriia bacterium]|nr:SpoIIE family protein phosphatase [Coriobacteriia bacterium]